MGKKLLLFLFSLILMLFVTSFGQAEEKQLFGDELIFNNVSVASIKTMSLKESPGVISVISEEEIANSGARDLIDVLRLVPGIEFAVDVQGAVSIGMRGNWGQEGKVLLVWDGHTLNELFYAGLAFGNHFPVDQIKKIEIIRGPGSAIYGGYAELAVINVITKKAKDISGIEGSVTYGQISDTFARKNVNISYGEEYENGLSLKTSVFMGQGKRSEKQFTDMNSDEYDLSDNSELNPLNINVNLNYKNISANIMVDRYHTTQRDEFGENLTDPTNTDFDSYFFDLSYDYKINDKLTLIPRFKYKRQLPWKEDPYSWEEGDPSSFSNYVYNKTAERYLQNLMVIYDPLETLNIITGIEYYNDSAKDNREEGFFSAGSPDESKTVSYNNVAGYFQGLIELPLANITLGARYDDHSSYGSSFVPRAGITKVVDKFHFKLLGSEAFRAPSIENINFGSDELEPEKTKIFEFETGYQIDENMSITANVFDIVITKPIVYDIDLSTLEESYINSDEVETRGLELEYRLKGNWGYSNITYSYYTVVENKIEKYAVPEVDGLLIGFPGHKITMNTAIKLNDNIILSPSLSYLSERYGYYMYDSVGDPLLKKFDPVVLANLYLKYNNIFVKDCSLGLGVFNILDEKYAFIQPYNGGHSPLPGHSQEIVLKLSYKY